MRFCNVQFKTKRFCLNMCWCVFESSLPFCSQSFLQTHAFLKRATPKLKNAAFWRWPPFPDRFRASTCADRWIPFVFLDCSREPKFPDRFVRPFPVLPTTMTDVSFLNQVLLRADLTDFFLDPYGFCAGQCWEPSLASQYTSRWELSFRSFDSPKTRGDSVKSAFRRLQH